MKIKTEKEIQIMKEGGAILAKILKELSAAVKPGISTEELDKLASELVFKYGAKPAFLNYNGFPAVLCTSVNEGIVHGLPSVRKLKEGDVLKLDMGVLYKGYNTDSAVTVLVTGKSKISTVFKKEYSEKLKLMMVTKKALEIGIKQARAGNTVGDIGSAVQKFIEDEGFGVVRELVGHGIGRELHEPPQVPNYGKAGTGEKLVPGMVIAIEPMVTIGDWRIKEGPDGFVFETKDGSLAAHFEHTVVITHDKPLILTI
jgi:methionyl aminopeptidase